MQVKHLVHASLGAAVLACWLLVLPGSAHSDTWDDGTEDRQQTDTDHDATGDGISAEVARITYTSTGGGGNSGHTLTSESSWTPPACYYAPVYTPSEMEAHQEEFLSQFHTPPWPPEDAQSVHDGNERRFGPEGEFPSYNLDKEGEGLFWMVVRNDDYPRDEQIACEYRIFWVDFEDPPPPQPGVVDAETLAELAWEHTRVPETDISLNPDGAQVVYLPTWVWLDEATFEPVTVRAELEDYGIWAETTATPTTLTLDPGTEDAELHPAGGCRVTDDGSIGEPYTEDRADDTPPCGLTYLRSTPDGGEYELEATLTWEVTWTDYQGNSGTLPDGVFSTSVDLTVDEVQTIVR